LFALKELILGITTQQMLASWWVLVMHGAFNLPNIKQTFRSYLGLQVQQEYTHLYFAKRQQQKENNKNKKTK